MVSSRGFRSFNQDATRLFKRSSPSAAVHLSSHSPLAFPSLSYNRIDDEGAVLFGQTLATLHFKPSLARLWHVNLLGNDITDVGVAALVTLMQTCPLFATLDVANAKSYAVDTPSQVVYIEHRARRNTQQGQHNGKVAI